MSKPFSSKAYWQEKNRRIQTQKEIVSRVMELPEDHWGEALFDLWPEKLPKVVRSAIPGYVLQDWRSCREALTEKRVEEFFALQEEMMDFEARMLQALATHNEKGMELLAPLQSMVGMKAVTIQSGELVFKFERGDGWNFEGILEAICWALEEGGGITVRQELSLRVQIPQPDGTMAWVPQERVYGFFCINGEWQPVTPAQMRHAYTHTPDGQPLPPDPETSFGDARDLVLSMRSRNKRSH